MTTPIDKGWHYWMNQKHCGKCDYGGEPGYIHCSKCECHRKESLEKAKKLIEENARLIAEENAPIEELQEQEGDEYRDKYPANMWQMHRKINEIIKRLNKKGI